MKYGLSLGGYGRFTLHFFETKWFELYKIHLAEQMRAKSGAESHKISAKGRKSFNYALASEANAKIHT